MNSKNRLFQKFNFKILVLLLIIIFFVIFFVIIKNKINENKNILPPESKKIEMSNPASSFCIENNGTLEIRNNDLGQYGVCIKNEKECDEWAYFRGECKL